MFYFNAICVRRLGFLVVHPCTHTIVEGRGFDGQATSLYLVIEALFVTTD